MTSNRGLLEKGSFQKSPFSEILETLEILEILESPRLWKIKASPTLSFFSLVFSKIPRKTSKKKPRIFSHLANP